MPAPSSFDYAIVRVVPHVERGERINVGVILYCRSRDFLAARLELDRERLAWLDPSADAPAIDERLQSIAAICAGGASAGPIGRLTQAERFHWLVSPRSTVVQTSRPHVGLCEEPGSALEKLFDRFVKRRTG